jgi:hypothetical protein
VSTLSKIFVVVNMVLAVAFAGVTATLYSKRVTYWHDKVKAERDFKVQLKAAVTEKETVEAANKELIAKNTLVITERDGLKDQLLAKVVENGSLATSAAVSKELATATTNKIGILVKSVKNMRDELKASNDQVLALKSLETVLRNNLDNVTTERNSFKSQVNKARQDLADLHTDHRRVSEELSNAEYVITKMLKKGYDVYKIVGPGILGKVPTVNTLVVDVRPTTGHVAIGAGSASGIKEGHIFLISRDKTYIGKVRITTVWDTFSGGTIVDSKRPFKAGDEAMTDQTP